LILFENHHTMNKYSYQCILDTWIWTAIFTLLYLCIYLQSADDRAHTPEPPCCPCTEVDFSDYSTQNKTPIRNDTELDKCKQWHLMQLMSHCCYVTLLLCHTAVMSHCCYVTLLLCHTADVTLLLSNYLHMDGYLFVSLKIKTKATPKISLIIWPWTMTSASSIWDIGIRSMCN
jgi:hypothetical protein